MPIALRPDFKAWVWTALILVACWFPQNLMPAKESRPPWHGVPHLDKVIHFSLFAGFGFLWMRAGGGRRRTLGVLAGGFLLAVASELGQAAPIVHRDPSVLDGLADTLGLLAGMAAAAPGARRPDAAELAER